MRKVLIIIILLILLASIFLVSRQFIRQNSCTMEAKICPDGTSVGRVGPDCEFEACSPVGEEHPCGEVDVDCGSQGTLTCREHKWQCDHPINEERFECQNRKNDCPELANPVCAYGEDEVKIKTYGNPCRACQDEDVMFYKKGICADHEEIYECPEQTNIDCVGIEAGDEFYSECNGPHNMWIREHCSTEFII